MLRCYITDRKNLPPTASLLDTIAHNLTTRVDWVQIREKDLSTRELFDLVSRVVALPRRPSSRILVNSRVDVALAAGASGCHLPDGSPPPKFWRAIAPGGFMMGVSCHSVEDVRLAERDGADYAILAPIFKPLSKVSALPPLGLAELARAAKAVRIPVFALGGITEENGIACENAGAAGIAGITLFQP